MVHGNTHTSGHDAVPVAVQARKWSFLAVFVLVLVMSYSLLTAMGLNAELKEKKVASANPSLTASVVDALPIDLPTKITIPEIDVDATIANPTSVNTTSLDAALLHGAVRYPTSAKLGEEGNVVLFGHSSYLPVVHNSAYKAFNGIQKLEKGDRITVSSAGRAYVYAVTAVYAAKADEDAIPLTKEGHTLTLVTCDSFASKQDRFVVTATLVESYPLAN